MIIEAKMLWKIPPFLEIATRCIAWSIHKYKICIYIYIYVYTYSTPGWKWDSFFFPGGSLVRCHTDTVHICTCLHAQTSGNLIWWVRSSLMDQRLRCWSWTRCKCSFLAWSGPRGRICCSSLGAKLMDLMVWKIFSTIDRRRKSLNVVLAFVLKLFYRNTLWAGKMAVFAVDLKQKQKTYILYIRIYLIIYIYMGVSKNRGTPKWMVCNGKPY